MKKNDYFIGECVDQSHDGKGIVKYEGFTYFVNGMITGEVGQIKCIKMLKNYERIRPIFWENFRRKRPKSF